MYRGDANTLEIGLIELVAGKRPGGGRANYPKSIFLSYDIHMSKFQRLISENLHDRVTRALAVQVLEAEREARLLVFPNEADLCQQLGVSRTILREAVKVLADKGMVETRQRVGTSANPRAVWNQLDPDILNWWAELGPDPQFLRDLCEVRLAIEPTAAGYAAVRGTPEEIEAIGRCLEEREARLKRASLEKAVDIEMEFHAAILASCHNSLLEQLSRAIRGPLRTALSFTTGLRTSDLIESGAHYQLLEAIRRHDAMKARIAAEKVVGLAMLHVDEAIKREQKTRSKLLSANQSLRVPGKSAENGHNRKRTQ